MASYDSDASLAYKLQQEEMHGTKQPMPVATATPVQATIVAAPQQSPVHTHTQPQQSSLVAVVEVPPPSGADISENEFIVLNYRFTVRCLALIDIIFTLLNLIGGQNGYYGLFLIIGPLCGYMGAGSLQQTPVVVYVAFCFLKLFYEIYLALAVSFIFILFALIQLWITKIVYTFFIALRGISPERRELLRNPQFIEAARVRMVYW